ncbi:MAG: pyruvate kinase, partial [Deltaproteobacteria bacterium]|nr:pyruvate kinase [Deltaproteobacteria bacterium]
MNEIITKYQPVSEIIKGQLLNVNNKNDSYPFIPLRALKRTKIIATIGPSCNDAKTLKAMILEGMNVARFNMSHGDHESHEKNLQIIRTLSKEMDRPVAVLADLQGPKIRIGKLKGDIPVEWRAGDKTVITVAKCEDGTAARVGTSYKGLAGDVKHGDRILVDDGRLRLRVEKVEGDDVHCLIVVGGTLRSKKGINLPGVEVSAGALSSKDKSDLSWAIEHDVDYIALSFVRSARDVRNMRSRIAEAGRNIPIIAKIERVEAVEQIDEIIEASDGIMVARGDLGIELSIEQLPIIQKDLILQASKTGKLVITATQMLESMIENPIPTRAEATDVANAVFDGTDAV